MADVDDVDRTRQVGCHPAAEKLLSVASSRQGDLR